MDAKSLLTSKTFWFNVVTGVLELSQLLPTGYGAYIGVVGNIILRILTKQPVTFELPFLK